MAQSLIRNYLHITFSTKNRKNLITENIENELYKYLGAISNNLECIPLKIGGYHDHVHLLILLSKNISLAYYIEKIKTSSSKWIKTKGENYKNFYWQRGYGAFSVNPSEVDIVTKYIANQKEHHRSKTFQDEFRAFLKKYNVDYDERYLWD